MMANLEGISTNSATLLCDEELEPGKPIVFCSKGHDLYGVVASRTFEPLLGWYVTLRLERSSRWTPQWFLPEHLFPIGFPTKGEMNAAASLMPTKAFT